MTLQYDYESLGPDRFQQMCQALLVRTYGEMQCFPVGMPDGGRDASSPTAGIADAVVYQIKYRKPTPNKLATPDEICSWLEKHLVEEILKVRILADRGAKRYVIMTNAQCSSHLDSGTRDRMQSWLDKNFPIPAQVWWRDDVDRRLDRETEIKRSFGLLRDVAGLAEMLGIVVPNAKQHEVIRIARSDRRISAILKYLRHQYERDRIVKFKQAELKPELLDVFVDVPAVPLAYNGKSAGQEILDLDLRPMPDLDFRNPAVAAEGAAFDRWSGLLSDEARKTFAQSRTTTGAPAAGLLLRHVPAKKSSKIVLEGAPGQGKSTVSQYVCQVHRARLLGLEEEIERFPADYRSCPILLPFHVDLRDLSTWLRGEDPFDIRNTTSPRNWANSLEAFLAAQVQHESGGMNFDVSDLDAVTSATPVVLMLDGLDEVPDLVDRKNVVNAVNEGVNRISYSCPSLLMIATSRPSAFARTPGFSKKDHLFLQMVDLPLSLVLDYTDGWLRSRNVPHKEAFEIRRVLGEKVGQPHIADLARNPMQLAILLWLVNRKGLSLPDKRTALYGAYMDTFLDREAEKSSIVRDERDLILELHGYVAWELHCQAEVGKSRGSIAETKLKALLKRYLTSEDYGTELVDQLFTGMTQRVMVLTSRVQNTFEFEVQPLREYFAARYLYSTAKTSPPGAERSGTRSDRFEALLRNPYWWNVTRFYAGFSDKGELANLVDLLEDLFEDGDFSLISYPRKVASTLLRDQVFSQRPRSATKALELVTSGHSIQVLAPYGSGDADRLTIGEGQSNVELVAKLEQHIERGVVAGYAHQHAAHLLAANRDVTSNREWWLTKWSEAKSQLRRDIWFQLLNPLRVLVEMGDQEIQLVCEGAPSPNAFWQTVMDSGRNLTPEVGSLLEQSLDSVLRSGQLEPAPPYYRHFGALHEVAAFAISRDYLYQRVRGYAYSADVELAFQMRALSDGVPNGLSLRIVEALREFISNPHTDNNLGAWESAHARLVEAFGGETRASQTFALAAGDVRSRNVSRRLAGELLNKEMSAVRRARYARQRKNDHSWWVEQVSSVASTSDAWFVLAAMLSWSPTATVIYGIRELDSWLKDFTVADLGGLNLQRSFHFRRQLRGVEEVEQELKIPRGLSHQAHLVWALIAPPNLAEVALSGAIKKSSDRDFSAFYAARRIEHLTLPGADLSTRLDEIKDSYKVARKGFAQSIRMYNVRPSKFNSPLAREVLRDPVWIPSPLVGNADQRLTNELSRKATPLAAIATRDGWFKD